MSDVKRFDAREGLDEHCQECIVMEEYSDGEYVLYEDYNVMRINHDEQLKRRNFYFEAYLDQIEHMKVQSQTIAELKEALNSCRG